MCNSYKRHQRKRGVILSIQGWQRLQTAEYLSALPDNGSQAYTLKQLSVRTGLSTNTLTKVRRREQPVDHSTLELYFQTFDLELSPDDYSSPHGDKLISTLATPPTPLNGPLALDSLFYIYRPPAEQSCTRAILEPGALICIKAPRKYGKTSLVARIISHAKQLNFRVALVNLRLANRHIIMDINQLLPWFCTLVTRSLSMPDSWQTYWNSSLGASYSCSDYFETYLLPESKCPLLVVLDDFEVLCNYPETMQDVLGMLRVWYEQSRQEIKNREIWQRIRLIIVHSTEVSLCCCWHQFPFNLGLSIELSGFTPEQTQELTQLYGLKPAHRYAERLMEFLGGAPYLTQLALFHLSQQPMSWDSFLETAICPNGIFNGYLQQQFAKLKDYPDLLESLYNIVSHPEGVEINPEYAFKLWELGLIQFRHQRIFLSCKLYHIFFEQHLKHTQNTHIV